MQEFNISMLMDRALRGWRTPVAFAAIFVLCVLIMLPGQKPVYSVTMTVMPAPNEQTGTTGNSGGALTTLLGFAGAADNSNYSRYQKLLISPVVAQRMEDHHGMLRYVFASNWDKQAQKWVPTENLRTALLGWLLRLANLPTWSPPNAATLAKFLEGTLLIVPSTQTDIVTITMNDRDVAFATRVMLAAHQEANAVLRDQVASRARQQVVYLQSKLAQTTVADYRATLLQILSAQEKTLMLTQTDASFAAQILSPPVAAPTPVSPRPVLSVFVAGLAGGLIGTMIVIFLGPNWWQQALHFLSRLREIRVRRVSQSPLK